MATILFAGYVTISELISWLVFSIADNSQSMKKLEKEAEESIWIKENRGPSIKEVVNSKVSYQIVLEGLRMYPPVWNFPRQATEDVYIQNIFIPKGTTVVPSSYISHRNEKYYKDPELWNPERWTKEFERSLPRGAYFPFGMSSTKCLGAEFAVLEAQIFILCFAKKYKWENCLNDGAPKIYPKISLKPKNGIPIIIQKKDL
jgi:cytochrome P450